MVVAVALRFARYDRGFIRVLFLLVFSRKGWKEGFEEVGEKLFTLILGEFVEFILVVVVVLFVVVVVVVVVVVLNVS